MVVKLHIHDQLHLHYIYNDVILHLRICTYVFIICEEIQTHTNYCKKTQIRTYFTHVTNIFFAFFIHMLIGSIRNSLTDCSVAIALRLRIYLAYF